MLPIQHTCPPGPDILEGAFNPKIFAASLSQVMDHYDGQPAAMHALYTDARGLLCQATHLFEGLCMLLTDIFSRLAGDKSPSALHRLEAAFTTVRRRR